MAERSSWVVDRTEAVSRGGMVACKTPQAAEAAAAVLAAGGNAIDAAVTCAFVSAVAEPWMNGIGGGGYMMVHRADRGETAVVEYPMIAPDGADAAMFPLTDAGSDAELFGWPAVVGNANIVGHRAAAVPGTVAGLALALERFGTLSLSQAIAPAIAAAEEGVPVTWHTTLETSRDLANLSRFPASRAVFLGQDGCALQSLAGQTPAILRQADLAVTLRTIADQGARAFYEGAIAAKIANHLRVGGAPFAEEDLRRYQASISPPLKVDYHGHTVATTGGETGGTTLGQAMRLLDLDDLGGLGHNTPASIHLIAESFRIAFTDRFAYLADPAFVDVPIEALLSDSYRDERRAKIAAKTVSRACAGSRERLGVTHSLPGSMPEYSKGGCTTHLSVIDREGNAVSLTQTLLSLWGCRVTVPGTGILLNNGMMWFDPEPGSPNSVAGGKRPLSNMAPLLLFRDGGVIAAIGSSGGRRIMGANAQIAMNLIDHGLSMQPAVSAPRVDASTPKLFLDARLPRSTGDRLRDMGHPIAIHDEALLFGEFASPACVGVAADGTHRGGVDPYYYPATALGVD